MAEEVTQSAESTEAVETAPSPPAESAQQEGSTSTPDLSEQIAVLQQKLDERLPAPTQEQPITDGPSLAQALLGAEADEDYDDTFEYGEEPVSDQQEPDPVLQRVEGIENHLNQREYQARMTELSSLVEQYPDIGKREWQEKIAGALSPLADRYGDGILLEPAESKRAYLAIKAEAVTASENPAEEARNRGASLEQEAGACSDGGELDEEEAIGDAIVKAGGSPSVFTT